VATPSPPLAARNEDAAPANNERASARPAEANREISRSADLYKEAPRKRGDERKFSERRRRQDLVRQNLDEAANVVRQMPRDGTIGPVVERDDAPRIIEAPSRRFGVYERDDVSPRVMNEPPPRFGFFGN
jgi:hypothetical protein